MIGLFVIAALLIFAIWVQIRHRGFAFTAWVFLCVGTALLYPGAFQSWGGVALAPLIVPLMQVIMFGMGTTLHFRDFLAVIREPWSVAIGMVLQFSVMPIAGYLLARTFHLEPELAVGVILIGACSGGLASNVMAYLAGANVPLSMAMTITSTFMAPVLTPLAMKLLAGAYLPVNFMDMMVGVFNIMIIPVLGGMAANIILFSKKKWLQNKVAVTLLGLVSLGLAILLTLAPSFLPGLLARLQIVLAITWGLFATACAVKLIVDLLLRRGNNWLNDTLSLASMVGICAILAIITAQTHSVLMRVGATIIIVAILHNFTGYFLGYWGTRLLGAFLGRVGYRLGWFLSPASRMNERDCRTVAFEVGMQNGAMATALAVDVLHSHVAALPPNIFGTWQNISGSLLVNYWRRRSPMENRESDSPIAIETDTNGSSPYPIEKI